MLSLGLAAVFLPESKAPTTAAFDSLGQIMLTTVIAALAFVLIEGPQWGWNSPGILVGVGIAIAALAVMVPYEKRHPNPVVPVALLTDYRFVRALSTAVLGFFALAGLLFANMFYLQAERGLSPTSAGLLTIPLALGATLSAQLSGLFVAQGRSREALLISGSLIAIASAGLWATAHSGLLWVIFPYFLYGCGFGFIADPVSTTALSSLPAKKAALASSLISTSKQFGQMLGSAAVGSLLTSVAGARPSQDFNDAGGGVWMLLASCGIGVVLLNLPRKDPSAAGGLNS